MTWHLGKIFEALHLTNILEKYAEQEAYENDCVKATKENGRES